MNDELANAMANFAAIFGAYYLNLLEHGLPPYLAIELVRNFQRIQLERMFKLNDTATQETAKKNG